MAQANLDDTGPSSRTMRSAKPQKLTVWVLWQGAWELTCLQNSPNQNLMSHLCYVPKKIYRPHFGSDLVLPVELVESPLSPVCSKAGCTYCKLDLLQHVRFVEFWNSLSLRMSPVFLSNFCAWRTLPKGRADAMRAFFAGLEQYLDWFYGSKDTHMTARTKEFSLQYSTMLPLVFNIVAIMIYDICIIIVLLGCEPVREKVCHSMRLLKHCIYFAPFLWHSCIKHSCY